MYPRAVTPNRKPYRTKDGYISALVYNDKQWSTFVDVVPPAWADDHLATLEQRARQIDTVYALLADTFLTRTTQDWLDLFRSLDIPAAPVRTPDELFDNAHLKEAGFFETVQTPNGPVRFPGTPAWFSRTPGRIAGRPPASARTRRKKWSELGLAAGGKKTFPGDSPPGGDPTGRAVVAASYPRISDRGFFSHRRSAEHSSSDPEALFAVSGRVLARA